MYADEFDQSPEQITLTNQWLKTKKRYRDDAIIERDRKIAIATKKRKPFRRNTTTKPGGDELASAILEEVELSALIQIEVLEAVVDNELSSSNDSKFESKLISYDTKKRCIAPWIDPPLLIRKFHLPLIIIPLKITKAR